MYDNKITRYKIRNKNTIKNRKTKKTTTITVIIIMVIMITIMISRNKKKRTIYHYRNSKETFFLELKNVRLKTSKGNSISEKYKTETMKSLNSNCELKVKELEDSRKEVSSISAKQDY